MLESVLCRDLRDKKETVRNGLVDVWETLAWLPSAPLFLPRPHLRDTSSVLGFGGQFNSAVPVFRSLELG